MILGKHDISRKEPISNARVPPNFALEGFSLRWLEIDKTKENVVPEKDTGLKDLLGEDLQDLLTAENQLVAALPKLADAAHHPKLKEAFTKHLEQTKGHVDRLKNALQLLGESDEAKTCKAMKGLVEEGQETLLRSVPYMRIRRPSLTHDAKYSSARKYRTYREARTRIS